MAFNDNNEERDGIVNSQSTIPVQVISICNRIIEQWTTKEKYCSTVHYGYKGKDNRSGRATSGPNNETTSVTY